MVAHNEIINDARVRKEAKTLKDKGFNINLIGFGDARKTPKFLDNIPLIIAHSYSQPYLKRLKTFIINLIKLKKQIHFYSRRLAINLLSIISKSIISKSIISNSKKILPSSRRRGLRIVFSFIKRKILPFFKHFKSSIFDILFFYFILITFSPNYLLIVFLIFLRLLYRNIEIINKFFIKLFLANKTPFYSFIANKLFKKISKNNYDIVHAHDIIALIAAVKLKKERRNIILIWDAHEIYTELNYNSQKKKLFIEKIINSYQSEIDYFITINESISNYYKLNFPKLPPALILMNAARYNSSLTKKSNKLIEYIKVCSSQKILIFQGGLSQGRGINLLIEAATLLSEDWTLVFMGNGTLVNEIKEKEKIYNATRAKDKPLIVYIPTVPYDELAEWTSGADLGIIPYELTCLNHLYCTPNKLWEYANCGVPILATGFDEITKIISKYGTGILLPKHFKSEDITNIINSIDSDKMKLMKDNCLHFNEVQNWERYEPKLLELYRTIDEKQKFI